MDSTKNLWAYAWVTFPIAHATFSSPVPYSWHVILIIELLLSLFVYSFLFVCLFVLAIKVIFAHLYNLSKPGKFYFGYIPPLQFMLRRRASLPFSSPHSCATHSSSTSCVLGHNCNERHAYGMGRELSLLWMANCSSILSCSHKYAIASLLLCTSS